MKQWEEFIDDIPEDLYVAAILDYYSYQESGVLRSGVLRSLCDEWQGNLGVGVIISQIARDITMELQFRLLRNNNLI